MGSHGERDLGVPRFVGDDEAAYPGWRLQARARLWKLERQERQKATRDGVEGDERAAKEVLGSELLLMLDAKGPAFALVKDLDEAMAGPLSSVRLHMVRLALGAATTAGGVAKAPAGSRR